MRSRWSAVLPVACLLLCAVPRTGHSGTLAVLEPDGTGDVVAEGVDYATVVLGDRWDMNELTDIYRFKTRNVSSLQALGGILSFHTDTNDARIWMLWPGSANAHSIDRGNRFPIDTSRFKQFTMRIKLTGGEPVLPHFSVLHYYEDEFSATPPPAVGLSNGVRVLNDGIWQIVTLDLENEVFTDSPYGWTDKPFMEGLRLDPNQYPDTDIEIDWVRLTERASAIHRQLVSWMPDGSASYDLEAMDAGGTRFFLTTVSGASMAMVDLSPLPPGDYAIVVSSSNGGEAQSPGNVTINEAPVLNFTQPDIRGDQANSYAAVEASNAWGPWGPADIFLTHDLRDIRFDVVPGVLTARSTGNDPYIVLNTPVDIDADFYRLLCFTIDVKLPRTPNEFSLVRILFGDTTSQLTQTDDIVLEEGLTEYCIGDMKNVAIEPNAAFFGPWAGPQPVLRFDPHENVVDPACATGGGTPETCSDIELASVVLAPFDLADPQFDISWDVVDADDDPSVMLFADIDKDPANGNETMIASGLIGSDGSFTWDSTGVVPSGQYEIFAQVSDGLNQVVRYAEGPLVSENPGLPDPNLVFKNGFE